MPKSQILFKRSSWWSASWMKILYLVLLGFFFLLYPGQNIYTRIISEKTFTPRRPQFLIPKPAPYPMHTTDITPGTDISATGIVVLDIDSGVYLYKRNEMMSLSPASTTKIMTALVALEKYDLDDIVTVKTAANEGQTMGLIAGERISVENLLYGALIASGNDAAWALAEHYEGGVDAFVKAMNDKAGNLHLTGSSFTNPVGYDDPNHAMTPLDLARLSGVALSNNTIAKMVAIPQITISDVTHTYFHPLQNINTLLGKIPGVGGIKTGWTEKAGENLVTLVERDGHRIIIVLLKSNDRFGETAKLIDWVFANHEWREFKSS